MEIIFVLAVGLFFIVVGVWGIGFLPTSEPPNSGRGIPVIAVRLLQFLWVMAILFAMATHLGWLHR